MKLREKDISKLLEHGLMLVKAKEYLQHNRPRPKYAIVAMTREQPSWHVIKSFESYADRVSYLEMMEGWSNVIIIEN